MEHEDLNFGVKIEERTPPETHRELQGGNRTVGEQSTYDLSFASHPVACVFTFLFKGLSIFMYLLLGNLTSSVTTFILVIVLSALDFWTVKNVTGRLLVGLRWWSDYDEKGNQVWRFQSPNTAFKANRVDSAFFWTSQWAATVTWGVFFVMKTLSLSLFWSLLTSISFSLTGINLYGYFKCQRDHGNKLASFKGQLASNVINTFFK